MRLAWRVFLSTSLVMLVLIGIAAWSLRAVNLVVHVNNGIVERTVPALRLETSLREALLALVRLETRGGVFRDPRYAELWTARANHAQETLAALSALLTSPDEVRYYRKSTTTLAAYRALALGESARQEGPTIHARRMRLAAARSEQALLRLTDATSAALERSQADTRHLELRTWNAVATALPLAIVAGLAGAAAVALGMARSLRRLSAAAGDVGRGTFSHPVAVGGKDEIGQLATAFNRMVEQLGALERMKEEFFAHISHELRTPLTAVREATSLLRDEVPGPLTPKQTRLVEIVRASTERVLGLVNQILELSRLQAGLLALDRRWVDVDAIVRRALDELRPQAEARGLSLELDGVGPAGGVQGDEERLVQVLVNLVANAIRFTPTGGTVRVETAPSSDVIEIAVADTGVGIAPEALPHVFDRYWQANGARGGFGLGLAIVKSIVQSHGGSIRADSTPGSGSRFTVRLPRHGAAA
jgi:two-component system sensor histidine kinase GlrK